MKPPPYPPDEAERLRALRGYAILDTPAEPDFDDLVELVAQICETPAAMISLIDEQRQWFKARVGMAARETSRELAFCAHTINRPQELFVVEDATHDERFADNPVVTARPGIRFYAGAPLVTPGGHALGTLCVVDYVPRQLRPEQLRALSTLSRHVMTQMQLRRELIERREIEGALRQSEQEQRVLAQRLVAAQAVAKVGSWETDLATLEVSWSAETHRIFGTDAAAFRPTHEAFLARVHPEDRALVSEAFARSAEQKQPQMIEHRIILPDGGLKFVEERWQIFPDAAGRPQRAIGTCRDITERRQREEERHRLFNLSLDLLCVAGFDGRLQQVSPAWTRCLGWSAEELTSCPMLDFVHPDDRASTLRTRERIRAGELSRGFENRYRCKDGTYRWLSWNVHPSIELQQVFAVARDVTERKQAEEKLILSRSMALMVSRLARIGAWRVELAGERLTWSDEVRGIHEVAEDYRPTVEAGINFYVPEHRDMVLRAYLACTRDGTAFDLEAQLVTARERRIWVRIIGEAVRDEQGRITGVQGALQDIAERKHAEQEIHDLAGRLTSTLESITDAFFTLGSDWRFTFLNREAERLLARSRTELLGREIWQEFPQAVGTTFEREYRQAMVEGRTAVFEEFYPPLNTWFAVRAYPSAHGLAVYFRDVTAARAAAERQAEQAAMLDQASDAIMVSDLGHRVQFWSRGAEKVYGRTAEEMQGRSIVDLLYRDPAPLLAAIAIVMARGEWSGELQHLTKGGATVTVFCRWTLVRDHAGRPKSVLMINSDVTERKRLEQQFLRVQRLESIGTLAGGIAHDLNNLLAPIVMGIGLLRQFESRPESERVIANIERSARRGTELVRQVLSFARGEDGARVAVHVGDIVHEVQAMVANTFPKNITIEIALAPDPWLVMGDPTQLNQVLLNLCVNARDAMPHGGRLVLAVDNIRLDEQYAATHRGALPGRYVRVRVTDTGSGMPREVLDRMFEPFFTTKEPGRGTGLGLSSALGIVRNLGGFIHVASEPGHGSTFEVFLPAQPDGVDAPPAEPAAPLARGHGELILVVDDEVPILGVTRMTLESFGYRVLTAEDGAQAVGLFARHRDEVAAVLTDMTMPVMDGMALIVALRRMAPSVRIIAASGVDTAGNQRRAAEAGVGRFLGKPYTAEALLAALDAILHEPAP